MAGKMVPVSIFIYLFLILNWGAMSHVETVLLCVAWH